MNIATRKLPSHHPLFTTPIGHYPPLNNAAPGISKFYREAQS
jgi:hypothetical protein